MNETLIPPPIYSDSSLEVMDENKDFYMFIHNEITVVIE